MPELPEPNEPRRGRDRVDQFLMPILWRLGDDAFLRLMRSQSTADLRRPGIVSGGREGRSIKADDLRVTKGSTVNLIRLWKEKDREYWRRGGTEVLLSSAAAK